MREGVPTHPIVIHCQKQHGGVVQPILMRTLSAHISPMDRQVQESLNILQEIRTSGHCLSQKNEWAGSKIADLEVRIPKGVAKEMKKGEGEQEEGDTGNSPLGNSLPEDNIGR